MRDLNYTDLISQGIDSFEYNNSLEFAPIIPCNNGWDYFIEKGRTSIISEVFLFFINIRALIPYFSDIYCFLLKKVSFILIRV